MSSATADNDAVVQSLTEVTLPADGVSWRPLIGSPFGPTGTTVITWVAEGSAAAGAVTTVATPTTATSIQNVSNTRIELALPATLWAAACWVDSSNLSPAVVVPQFATGRKSAMRIV